MLQIILNIIKNIFCAGFILKWAIGPYQTSLLIEYKKQQFLRIFKISKFVVENTIKNLLLKINPTFLEFLGVYWENFAGRKSFLNSLLRIIKKR